MNDPPTSYEALETELEAALEKLEAPGIPLEERLRLHNRATELYQSLEKGLAEARAELERRDPAPDTGEAGEYEALSSRLEKTVTAMEDRELPLRRVLELRREALGLAARCERILENASGRIRNLDRAAGNDRNEDEVPF